MSNYIGPNQMVGNFILPPENQQMQIQKLVFDASTAIFSADMSGLQANQQTSIIQSIIVDTRNLSTGATITIQVGQQLQFNMTFPPGIFASYNIPAAEQTYFYMTSTAGASGLCYIWLQNFPCLPQSYTSSSGSTSQNVNITNTSVPVTFPSAQPVSISGTLTANIQNNSSDVLGTDFKDLISNAATTTLTTTSLSNMASGFYTDVNLRVLPNTSIATSGIVNCTITGGGSWSLAVPLYITNTASTSEVFIKVYNGSSRPIAFGALTAKLDTALTTGGIVVFGSYMSSRSIVD